MINIRRMHIKIYISQAMVSNRKRFKKRCLINWIRILRCSLSNISKLGLNLIILFFIYFLKINNFSIFNIFCFDCLGHLESLKKIHLDWSYHLDWVIMEGLAFIRSLQSSYKFRWEAMGINDSYYFRLGFEAKEVVSLSWGVSKLGNYCQ